MKLPSGLLLACGLLVHLWVACGEPTLQASDASLLRGAGLSGRSLKTPPYAGQYDACGDNGRCCYGNGQDGGQLYCLRQKGNKYYAQCNTIQECRRSGAYVCDTNQGACNPAKADRQDRSGRFDDSEEDTSLRAYSRRDESRHVGRDSSRISAYTGGKGHDCKSDYCCASGFKCFRWSNGQTYNGWVNEKFECMAQSECDSSDPFWNCSPLHCKKGDKSDRYWRDETRHVARDVSQRYDESRISAFSGGKGSDCKSDYCCAAGYYCYRWSNGQTSGNWVNEKFECMTPSECRDSGANWNCNALQCKNNPSTPETPENSGNKWGGKGSDCKGHNCCARGFSCFRWSNGQRSGNWVNEKFECMTLRECRSSDRFWDCRPLQCNADEWDAEDGEGEWDAEDGEDEWDAEDAEEFTEEDEEDAEDEEDNGRDRYDTRGRDEARYVAHDRSRISAFTGGKGHDCKRDFCCSSGYNCYRWSNGQSVGNWVNEKFECMTASECHSAGQGWYCHSLQCKRGDYRHDSGRRDASRVHSSSGWSYTGQYQACGKNIRTCCSGNGADGGQLYCLRQRSGSGYSQCNTLQECERSRGGYDCNTQQGSCGY